MQICNTEIRLLTFETIALGRRSKNISNTFNKIYIFPQNVA